MRQNVEYTFVIPDNCTQVLNHLKSCENLFGFDVETKQDGSPIFIQIYSPTSNQTFIFCCDDEEQCVDKLVEVWGDLNVVGHNIQFDLSSCLKKYGSYPNPVADTYLLACSLQESQKGLKPLCNLFFGFPVVAWEDLFSDYNYEMNEEKWHYVANDPYYTYLLYEHYQQLGAYRFVKKAHEIDIKAMIFYMEASTQGLQIDQNKFNDYLEQYTNQVDELQLKLNAYAGWEVRTSSTKDVKKLLFEQMGLPIPPITTDKGEVSVSKEALSYVPDTDGIVSLISQIKESKAILAAMKNL